MKTKILASAIVTAALLGSGVASALQESTTFNVTADVTASCTIAATDILFNTVTAASVGSTNAATGSVTVNCSPGQNYFVYLTPSSNSTDGTGKLTNGDYTMDYGLHAASGSGPAWGNTSGGDIEGSGTGNNVAYPVYATLTSFDGHPGTYSDVVTAAVSY